MKTAISIPKPVFAAAEKLRKRLGTSRSALYARAVADLVKRHEARAITEELDAVYGPGGVDSRLDPGLRAAARKAFKRAE